MYRYGVQSMNSMRTMENLVGSSMSKAAGAENMQLSLFPMDTASAASPEPIDPPSVVSSGKAKVDVNDLVYETKNGVKRMDTAKLAIYIREEGNYFYVPFDNGKRWYLYDEEQHKYVQATDNEVKGMIKSFVPPEAVDPSDIDKVFRNLSTDGFNSPHKRKESEINGDENIINLQNGIYNISERRLMPHSPEYISTLQIPCDYKPVSECANNGAFDSYANHFCHGDQEQIKMMLQVLGLAISNIDATRGKQAVFFLGEGNTGKSLFRELAVKLIGKEFNSSIDLKTMESRFGKSSLYQKRIAGSSDMGYDYIKNLTTFKSITGGDDVTTEFKGKNYFEMTFRGLLWFCGNRMPEFGGDRGSWVYERICIMKALGKVYDTCDPPEDTTGMVPRDSQLLDKLWEEREYIVSRAIEALYEYIDNNYKFSTTSLNRSYLEEYKAQNDSVTAFIKTCCTNENAKGESSKSKVYAVYQEWCKENKRKDRVSKIEFRRMLERIGMGKVKIVNGTHYFADFTLNDEAYDEYKYVFLKRNAWGA